MFRSLSFHDYPIFIMSNPGGRLILALLLVWTLIWKAIALWKAGRNNHLTWFVILFLVNTLGILDIVYIYTAGKKKHVY